jgi:hypothetical protein
MLARDIDRLVFEQFESAQDILKVLLDILKNSRGSLEQTTEQTSLLEIFKLFRRESQGADDAARGKKEGADAHGDDDGLCVYKE